MTTKKSTLKAVIPVLGKMILVSMTVSIATTLLLPWLKQKSSASAPTRSDKELLVRQVAPYRHYSRSHPYHYIGYTTD